LLLLTPAERPGETSHDLKYATPDPTVH
jgi:hypothetical protein